jgi:DNA helicase-2/ATP-dependent DNA helicase PcrA
MADFRVGDRVRHSVFGEGLILEVSPHGEDLMLRVSFSEDGSQRRLLSRLAHLERVESKAKESE